jgi:hypothetical protein
MDVPDGANYDGYRGNSRDFEPLPDKTKIDYEIHKAEFKMKPLKGVPYKALEVGLICRDMETGISNYVYDSFYIDSKIWLLKDKRNQYWVVNQFLAFTNSCGLREQGVRILKDEWFSDPECYTELCGKAVVELTTHNNKYYNKIKYYMQRNKASGKQKELMESESGASVQVYDLPEVDLDEGIPF